MDSNLPWVIMRGKQILGTIFAVDCDAALDKACMIYADDIYPMGDDTDLVALHPAEDF